MPGAPPRFVPARRGAAPLRAVQFAVRAQQRAAHKVTGVQIVKALHDPATCRVAAIWEEAAEKIPTLTLDRVDMILQAAFVRSKWCVPADNPILAVRSFYHAMDHDRSGKLSRAEFRAIFYSLKLDQAVVNGRTLSPNVMDALFKRYDFDRSGRITA